MLPDVETQIDKIPADTTPALPNTSNVWPDLPTAVETQIDKIPADTTPALPNTSNVWPDLPTAVETQIDKIPADTTPALPNTSNVWPDLPTATKSNHETPTLGADAGQGMETGSEGRTDCLTQQSTQTGKDYHYHGSKDGRMLPNVDVLPVCNTLDTSYSH